MRTTSLAAALLMTATSASVAQQTEIKWTQTINVPKGQNMPRDRADILGLELGDTYDEAKAKLQKLAAEGIQSKPQATTAAERMAAKMDGQRSATPPMREERRIYNLKAPAANSTIAASFVQKIELTREMPTGSGKLGETIAVYLSAPSSGHQVVGVTRSVTYYNDGDQPLISETLAQLKAKMKFEPQAINAGSIKYRFQFDNGKPFAPSNPTVSSCLASYGVDHAGGLKAINETGNCDAVFEMSAQTGISRNHASILYFTLSDNDRTKANLTADFTFLSEYVQKLQQDTRGAPPKL